MAIRILITNDEGILMDEFWTDESYPDICNAIRDKLSVYDSKEELDEANNQPLQS